MKIGEYSYVSPGLQQHFKNSGAELIIGRYCSIGNRLSVWLGGDHETHYISTYPFGLVHKDKFKFVAPNSPSTNGDVVIGNDVWIAADCTIMSGVTIGDGAVIANNSHVVKDVAPYTIVGGNPAKEIKKRFSDDDIAFLLDFKWWDKPVEEVAELSEILCSSDIDKLRELQNE